MKQRSRAGLCVVRVYGPLEVRTKSPKRLGHMKLPSSSRSPYVLKIREPMGNPMTSCASPQDFSKIFRPSLKLKVDLAQLSHTDFLRFWDNRRLVDSRTGSCGFPIGSHTGHRPMSHVRALKIWCSVWVLTAPYGSAPHEQLRSYDWLRSVCIRVFTSPVRHLHRQGPVGTVRNP